MFGKIVKIRVTNPFGSFNKKYGYKYLLNLGMIEGSKNKKNEPQFAYIMGINHPVKNFEGKIVASIKYGTSKNLTYIVAPKSTRYINLDIFKALSFLKDKRSYTLECFYESSCGAVVFHNFKNENGKNIRKYLLIRNKRSSNWGFAKGHIERDETETDAARREILEETNLNVNFIDGFCEHSNYTIRGKIEKTVSIFLAESTSSDCKMQESEIAEIDWFSFDEAMNVLTFENDKRILRLANQFLNHD